MSPQYRHLPHTHIPARIIAAYIPRSATTGPDVILVQPASQPASLLLDPLFPFPPPQQRNLPNARIIHLDAHLDAGTQNGIDILCRIAVAVALALALATPPSQGSLPTPLNPAPPPSWDWIGYISNPVDIPVCTVSLLVSLPPVTTFDGYGVWLLLLGRYDYGYRVRIH